MKILERLRNRSPHGEAGAPGSSEASSADEQRLPIARYDQLDGKQVFPQLSQLSQVELAASTPTSARTESARSCSTGCAG